MAAPIILPTYPWTGNVGGLVIDIRAIGGRTATISLGIGDETIFRFERPHWDGLRAAFLAIAPLQELQERQDTEAALVEAAGRLGVELLQPNRPTSRWLMKLMRWTEKWASIRVPCSYGALYVGLADSNGGVGLSTSWHGVALQAPCFSEANQTILIEHIVFATEHAKTILETH